MICSLNVDFANKNYKLQICKSMLKMDLVRDSGERTANRFEGTFENAQRGKVKQMQPMWLCIFSCRPFEDTFENAQCGKAKQMQPMRLCILLCKHFENTFENTQWRKIQPMQPM